MPEVDAAARARDPRVVQVSVGARRQLVGGRDRPRRRLSRDRHPPARPPQRLDRRRGEWPARERQFRARRPLYVRPSVRAKRSGTARSTRRWRRRSSICARSTRPRARFTVLLGPGWPGVLLHEAVGHGLEGDFNRKGTSAFSGRIGERVAARRRHGGRRRRDGKPDRRRPPRLAQHRRRRHADRRDGADRGRHPQGLYAGPPQRAADGGRADRQRPPRKLRPRADAADDQHLHARRQRRSRRASVRVKNGIFAKSFGGGQVDIVSGKFVFSCTEAYKIENGKLGDSIKGATLIGDGPSVLTKVIGHRQRHGDRRGHRHLRQGAARASPPASASRRCWSAG